MNSCEWYFVAIYGVLLCSEHLLKALCTFTQSPVLILWHNNWCLHFINEDIDMPTVSDRDSHATDSKLVCSKICAFYPYSFIIVTKNLGEIFVRNSHCLFFSLGSSWIMFMWCVVSLIEEVKLSIYLDLMSSCTTSLIPLKITWCICCRTCKIH